MRVSGFTFIKNAVLFGYPIRQSIESILPLCDEFVVAVGDCEDGTRELIASMDSDKIRIIDTVWDKELTRGGEVLAAETNKAFAAIDPESTWAFYIQGDEVIHEKYLPTIKAAMLQYADNDKVEGLLFRFRHFWGSFDYVGKASRWYKYEVRVIKNKPELTSYKDAQGFRKKGGRRINSVLIDAEVFHYGWVRPPKLMQNKVKGVGKYWSEEGHHLDEVAFNTDDFEYRNIEVLEKFEGTHPKVMHPLIEAKNWNFEFDISKNKPRLKDRLKDLFEDITGHRIFDFKNYRLIKPSK